MPFAGFEDFSACKRTMIDDEGHDEDSAEQICGALQAEAKADTGNVEELREALERGRGLIADVGVDILSGVGEPAIDSRWTMFKSTDTDHDYRTQSPYVYKDADSKDKRIAYAAAMIPRELDKEGDVVPTPAVEKAAHNYLTEDGGVDTDHSLIEGDGEVVESWVLKQERDFELPDGGSETYPAGTWMVGIKWAEDAWQRIQEGDLTGLSIYGMADNVPLGKSIEKEFVVPFADEAVVDVVYASERVAEKAADAMGLGENAHELTIRDEPAYMPGESHDEYVDAYLEFAEDAAPNPETGDTDETAESADDGATPTSDAGESAKQNSTMTDDPTDDTSGEDGGGGDGGDTETSLKDLKAELDSATDEIAELKDALEDGGNGTEPTDKADAMDLLEDAAIELAEEIGGDVTAAEIEDELMAVADGMLNDEEPNADGYDEKESDGDGGEDDETEKAATEDANFSKGSTGNGTAATAKEAGAEASDGVPGWSKIVEDKEA